MKVEWEYENKAKETKQSHERDKGVVNRNGREKEMKTDGLTKTDKEIGKEEGK